MILNIAAYHFASIDDPDAFAAALRASAQALELRGTILVAGEGVNLFLAGGEAAIRGFVDELREQAESCKSCCVRARKYAKKGSRGRGCVWHVSCSWTARQR